MKVTRCLKLVSIFYSILALGGGATAGLGIWSEINSKASDFLKVVDDSTLTALLSMGPPSLIALGFVLALMGLIGCLGALKRKSWMVLVFFIVVLIIFILQVAVSVFLLLPKSVKEKPVSRLEQKFVQSLQTTYKPNQTHIWDGAMMKLKCCGFKNYTDFPDFVKKNDLYPKQCCGEVLNTCSAQKAEKEKVRGCIDVLMNENIPVSGALSFLIGIAEIVALFVSLKVYRCLRSVPDIHHSDNL